MHNTSTLYGQQYQHDILYKHWSCLWILPAVCFTERDQQNQYLIYDIDIWLHSHNYWDVIIHPILTEVHYSDVIMGTMASQITSLTIVYSTVYSGADQIKHQSSASLAFVRGIHRWWVNSPHKWPVTRKMFHLMKSSWNNCIPVITWINCKQWSYTYLSE